MWSLLNYTCKHRYRCIDKLIVHGLFGEDVVYVIQCTYCGKIKKKKVV